MAVIKHSICMTITAVAFSAILSACGGGGSDAAESAAKIALPASSAAPDPTPAQTPTSIPVVSIVVYGDDAMMGATVNSFGMFSLVMPNEPQDLQAALQAQFGNTGITVIDHATGGTSSSLMNEINGTDGSGAPFAQRIAASSAEIVVDNHAVNDALGGETVNDYAGYLGQWIIDVRAANKIPVLEEPGPVCDGNHPQLGVYVQAMDAAAEQYGVALIRQYAYISSIAGWCSHMAQGFYPDAYIDAMKAKQERAVIAPLIQANPGK